MAAEPATTLPLHHIDVETYDRIVASGALDGRRVELLAGQVVDMSPKSPAHVLVVNRIARHFAATPRWWIHVQDPISVLPDSEPEPDLAVHDHESSPSRHPRTALLVIEVAVTSQTTDRTTKADLYARAGIPIYWLIDVPARTTEVRTQPGASGYAKLDIHSGGTLLHCPLEDVPDLDLAALFAGVSA